MGANPTTRHLSVIFSVECQSNFIMRLLKPIVSASPSSFKVSRPAPDTVMVEPEAEDADNEWIQRKAKDLVWARGCTS